MDFNKDKKVTLADFENLAVKYLCGSGFSAVNMQRFSETKTTVTTTITSSKATSGNLQK
jgi:hypothetical protein